MSGYVDNAANELNNVRLNASIDSVITGDGSHSSDTLIGGGKGAAGGIDHEHFDSGHSTTIWGGSAAGAGASHEGNARHRHRLDSDCRCTGSWRADLVDQRPEQSGHDAQQRRQRHGRHIGK